jgi:hypothetical protein
MTIWINDDCKDAIKNYKKAKRQFGKHPTSDNVGNFRIFRAKARRTLKQNRRPSWRNFVSKLNWHTPMNNVWNMVQQNPWFSWVFSICRGLWYGLITYWYYCFIKHQDWIRGISYYFCLTFFSAHLSALSKLYLVGLSPIV